MSTTQLKATPRPGAQSVSSLQTIALATDFSENADRALDWVTEIAKAHGAKIALVHAINAELSPQTEVNETVTRLIRHNLDAMQTRLKAKGISAQVSYDFGRPWDVISRVSKGMNADMIVVGAHGQSTMAEHVLGTSADRLIRTSSIPILVHRHTATNRTSTSIRTVLAATDFSEEAALAISTVVRLLRGSMEPARLVLFHAVPLAISYTGFNATATMSEYWDEAERTAVRQLEALAAPIRSDQLLVEVKTCRRDAADAIFYEAEMLKPDLIAIGTVGRSGLNRFFMGSVAQHVLHHAKCPVLTVRKPDAGEPIRLSAV